MNCLFHLTTTDKGSTVTRATYYMYNLSDVPFDILSYVKIELFQAVNQRKHSKMQYILLVKFEDQVFDIESNFTQFEKNTTDRQFYTFLEFDFGDVLSTIFKCQKLSQTYVTRFLYLKSESDHSFVNVSDPTYVPFIRRIYTYWVITRKNAINYDNEINYSEFLDDCHQSKRNYVLVILGLMLVMIALGAAASCVHRFLNKNKIFPH
jgi:hypothetical protein